MLQMHASLSLTCGNKIVTIRGRVNVGSRTHADHTILQTGKTAKVSRISDKPSYMYLARNDADVPILIEVDRVLDGIPARDLLVLRTNVTSLNGCIILVDTLIKGLMVQQVETSSTTYQDIELGVSEFIHAKGLPIGSHDGDYSQINDNQKLQATKISLRKRAAARELTPLQRSPQPRTKSNSRLETLRMRDR